MNNRKTSFAGNAQNSKIVSDKKREAIQRANNLLNFKVDYTKTTIYRKKDVEQKQISGRFVEDRNNVNGWPSHMNGGIAREQRESLKENEVSKAKGDKQDMDEVRKESNKGNMPGKERITTKQLIAVTDNKVGFNLFLRDTEKKIMTMQFYQGSPQALNGELLKKIMRAVESYIRESQRNQEED